MRGIWVSLGLTFILMGFAFAVGDGVFAHRVVLLSVAVFPSPAQSISAQHHSRRVAFLWLG